MSYYQWKPYVPVAERRRKAARKVAALTKRGRKIDPVVIDGRKIARTFWGRAWCDNLESYSDYANRLPRGRTYVRNGSVIDLQIETGKVKALVSGSSIYQVEIAIKRTAPTRWKALAKQCAGRIDSLVELLRGKFSKGVMAHLVRRDTGLFPAPREISLGCSCPDWASMCKHVAAVLYAVGARLDHAPEMLFTLRGVDHMELVAQAGSASALGELTGAAKDQVMDTGGLSDIFGIELDDEAPASSSAARKKAARSTRKIRGSVARKKKTRAIPAAKQRKRAAAARPKVRSVSVRAKRKPTPTRKSKRLAPTITARELVELGVPRSTFQNWVTSGTLIRTDQRGVYRTTAGTEQRIDKALRKRPRSKQRK